MIIHDSIGHHKYAFPGNVVADILECARLAPSADNSQPWRFEVQKNTILLYYDRRKQITSTVYNVNAFADYVALGTVIENIVISARALGYKAEVNYQPSDEIVGVISLTPAPHHYSPLYDAIRHRHTNRKPYKPILIPQNILEEAEHIATDRGTTLSWILRPQIRNAFAEATSLHDRILWEESTLRTILLNYLRIGPKVHYDGLPIETLELGWQAKPFTYITAAAQWWPWLWKTVAVASARYTTMQIESAPALGLLTIARPPTPITFLRGGEIFENLWLFFTSHHISLQPLFGPLALFFNHTFARGGLQPHHRSLQEKIVRIFNAHIPPLKQETPIAFFRIGYAPPPSMRAPRKPLEALIMDSSLPTSNKN